MDEYLSLNDAAKYLNVDRSTLYRWAKAKKIVIYKKGRQSLIKKSEAEKVKIENETIKPLYQD